MKRLAALAAAMTAAFATASALAADFQPTRFTDQIVGQGPDVILIPGLASSRSVWDAEAEKLKGHYRLHLIQLNGFGGAPAGGFHRNVRKRPVEALFQEGRASRRAQ